MKTGQREGKQLMIDEDKQGQGTNKEEEAPVMQQGVILMPEMMLGSDKKKCAQILRDREMAVQLHVMEVQLRQRITEEMRSGRSFGDGQQMQEMQFCQEDQSNRAVQNKDVPGEESNIEDMGEVETEIMGETERGNLGESEEYLDSQESGENFARKLGVILPEESTKSQEEETRRSKRLRYKEDKKPQEMAIERKEAQNAFIHKENGGKSKKAGGK